MREKFEKKLFKQIKKLFKKVQQLRIFTETKFKKLVQTRFLPAICQRDETKKSEELNLNILWGSGGNLHETN